MGSALADAVPAAVGLALVNPLPVMAVIALLFSPRAAAVAPAFAAGWMLGLAGALALLVYVVPVERVVGDAKDPSTAASLAQAALGLGLLWLALGKWRGRPRAGEAAALPGWMASLEGAGPLAAFGLGAGLAALNPKNLAFVVTAAVAIAEAHLAPAPRLVPVAAFALFASVGVVGPTAWRLLAGDGAQPTLEAWRSWLAANYATMMTVVFLLFGTMLLSKGIGGLIG